MIISWIVFANEWLSFHDWWWATIGLAVGAIFYPAQLQYAEFKKARAEEIDGLLCVTCKHFDEENILCTMLDEHPRKNYIPCDGEGWEGKNYEL